MTISRGSETIQKLRDAKLGKTNEDRIRLYGHPHPRKDVKITSQQITKFRETLRNKSEEEKAIQRTNTSISQKRRFSKKENHPLYGKHHRQETIEKMSLAKKGKPKSNEFKMKRKKWCLEHSDIMTARAKKAHRSCPRISSQEILLKNTLIKDGINDFTQQEEYELGFMDFCFPDKKIAIFVDGIYWHNYPYGKDKDKKQNEFLISNGYSVLRFWETEIEKNIDECVGKIRNALRSFGGDDLL